MQEQQDNMSLIKKLTRINKEGSSMSAEERVWFEHTKKLSEKQEAQAQVSIKAMDFRFDNFFE